MKRSGFDHKLNKLNQINLTEQESSASYQKILSNTKKRKKRKNLGTFFRRPITGFATIIVLIAAGWFLSDLVTTSSISQPGDETPPIVENDLEDEQPADDSAVVEPYSCVDVGEELNYHSEIILVYFQCLGIDDQYPPFKTVIREVNQEMNVESRIEYAVRQVIQGPSPKEIAAGYISIFNEETADLLNRIELKESGHLIVDFIDFSKIIPNGSASAASFDMMESLNKTVSQFAEVQTMEYRFDGSCDQFYGWIQQGCTTYEADEYRVDPEVELKNLLLEKAEVNFQQLMNKDWEELANHIFPARGLVYSPYSNVGDDDDLHFTKLQVREFAENDTQYIWSWDQSETKFMATPDDFVNHILIKRNHYVYDYDEITYNHSEMGTMINTIHDVYPDGIYVEYLDEPDRDSLDWYYYQAIRFVYEEIDNEWYLVAIVRGAYNP